MAPWDRRYAAIENGPFADGEIILRLVFQGEWRRLIFNFDNERFTEGEVTLPVINVENGRPVFVFTVVAGNVENGRPVFVFTVVTDNPVVQFSGAMLLALTWG